MTISQTPNDSTIQPLPEDNDTPFSPADPAASNDADILDKIDEDTSSQPQLDDTHQATDSDSDIDVHEEYDEGLPSAAGASEPNADNALTGYDPSLDQRKNNEEA